MSNEFRVGQTIPELRVGNQVIRNVQVTAQNVHIIGDGDIDAADIERLRGNDGDATNLTAADFQLAGFDVSTFKLMEEGLNQVIAGMGETTQEVTPQAAVPSQRDLSVMDKAWKQAAQQYVAAARRESTAAKQTVNGFARQGLTVALASSSPDTQATTAQRFRASLAALPADQQSRVRQALITYATRTPDLNQQTAMNVLMNAGLSEADAARTLHEARSNNLREISGMALPIYDQLGGDVPMATYYIATGDGSGTTAPVNGGQGLIPYSANARLDHGRVENVREGTITLPIADPNQPVSMLLTASGADGAGGELTVTYAGKDYRFTIGGDSRLTEDRLPPGVTVTRQDKGGLLLTFSEPPGDSPVTVHQRSGRFAGQRGSHPFDEIFTAVRLTNTLLPERTTQPPPVLVPVRDPDPTPPPALSGDDIFAPNRIVLQQDDVVGPALDAMADYLADNPDLLQNLDIDLSSLGANRGGVRVDERQFAGKTYGDTVTYTVNGERRTETLTAEATQADRSSEFGLQINDGRLQLHGVGRADPFRATISAQDVDRTRLTTFLSSPQGAGLTENDVLGALRQFELLAQLQERLNDRLQSQGQQPVNLLETAQVALANGQHMTYAQFQDISRSR